YLEGYYYKPRVDWELLERHGAGLIALSGCLSGRVCKALEENRPADAAAAPAPLPTVATGDVHYLRHEDARAHEALLCIQSGDSLKNESRWKFDTDQFFFKSPTEMAADFAGHEAALRRTLEIAERCSVELALGNILLPRFP